MILQWKKDLEYKKLYDTLDAEFMIFDEIFNARKKVGITQEDVSKRMGIGKDNCCSIKVR